jgi:hypothetical protein
MSSEADHKRDVKVFKRYGRAIVHMRKQHERRKLGLILGAGVSSPFKIPTWKALLTQIAKHPRVKGKKVDRADGPPTARAEMLYRHFAEQRKIESEAAGEKLQDHALERQTKGEWLQIIRELLYESIPPRDSIDRAHPYLSEFLGIVKDSPLTVTYNFDSCLEMMLLARQKRKKDKGRYYETIFDGSIPFRSRSGIIYHPNGFLPENVLEGFSDDIVFSEQSFGDQMLDNVSGRHFSFAHHLSKNTCLFMGLSFEDENLRHLLRRSATTNPGHYHYSIQWRKGSSSKYSEYEDTLAEYRFEIYNLITLFLNDAEIAALGRLLGYEFDKLEEIANEAGSPLTWVYYITGVPGIGKTSVIRHMQSLMAYDEWPEEPLPTLIKPYPDLTPHERRSLDNWVARQFAIKNEKLISEEPEGVYIIDRATLDPITFVNESQMSTKAKHYQNDLKRGKEKCELRRGNVLLLVGDTKEIATRLWLRGQIGRNTRHEYLQEQQEKLRSIYCVPGVQVINTENLSLLELVKKIARIIHREPYPEADLEGLLQSIIDGDITCHSTLSKPSARKGSTSHPLSSTPPSKASTARLRAS